MHKNRKRYHPKVALMCVLNLPVTDPSGGNPKQRGRLQIADERAGGGGGKGSSAEGAKCQICRRPTVSCRTEAGKGTWGKRGYFGPPLGQALTRSTIGYNNARSAAHAWANSEQRTLRCQQFQIEAHCLRAGEWRHSSLFSFVFLSR